MRLSAITLLSAFSAATGPEQNGVLADYDALRQAAAPAAWATCDPAHYDLRLREGAVGKAGTEQTPEGGGT